MNPVETNAEQIVGIKPFTEEGPMTPFCEHFSVAMNLLSRRWMGQVLRVLITGPHRFNEILDAIPGISDPLLTHRLRELEANKLLERKVIPSSPIRVEYELTAAGQDLEEAFKGLAVWAGKWHHILMSEKQLDQCDTENKAERR